MLIKISFPGKEKVQAEFDGFTVLTDQPLKYDGDGSAPAPFDLFLASLGTCAGYFVKSFCDERKIDTAGLSLTQQAVWDDEHHLREVKLTIRLPDGFPEKYKNAVISSAQLCSVKKAFQNPPEFKIEVTK